MWQQQRRAQALRSRCRRWGPSPHYPVSASTAFAGGRFLTVWEETNRETRRTITNVYGALQDPDGKLVAGQSFPVIVDEDVSGLRLVGVGNRFALFWNRGDERETLLSFIDRNGIPAPPIELDIPDRTFLRDAQWNGSYFAIAYQEILQSEVTHTAILDESGRILKRFRLAEREVVYPQIVPESGSFVILVATIRGDLTAHRIFPDGEHMTAFITSMQSVAFTGLSTAEGVRVTWTSRDPQIPAGRFDQVTFGPDGSLSERNMFQVPLDGRVHSLRAVRTSDGERLFVSVRDSRGIDLMAIVFDGDAVPSAHPLVSDAREVAVVAAAGQTVLALDRDSSYQIGSIPIRGLAAGPRQLLSVSAAVQSDVLLTPVGNRFLVAWTERQAFDRLTSKATLVDDSGRRASPLLAFDRESLAIASNGSGAVLLRPSGLSMIAIWFDTKGQIVGESIVAEEWHGRTPVITWAGTHYVVAWPLGDSIAVATLTAPRAPASVRLLSIASPQWSPRTAWGHFYDEVDLVFDGENLLLVAIEFLMGQWPFDPPADSAAMTVRLDSNGTPLAGNWMILDRQRPVGLSVTSSGLDVAVVTWSAQSVVRAFTIPRHGVPLGENSVVVFEAPRDVSAAITWTGRDYAVVISHEAFKSRLALKYYSATFSETRPAQTTDTDSWIERPAVSASVTGDLLIAGAELQQGQVKLAVTYQTEMMRELRNPPAGPEDVAVTWPEDYQAVVTWDPPASAEGFDGYVVHFRALDSQQRAQLFTPDVRSAALVVYRRSTRIMVRTFNEAGLSPAARQPERPRAVSR